MSFSLGDKIKVKATGKVGTILEENGHACKVDVKGSFPVWYHQDEVESPKKDKKGKSKGEKGKGKDEKGKGKGGDAKGKDGKGKGKSGEGKSNGKDGKSSGAYGGYGGYGYTAAPYQPFDQAIYQQQAAMYQYQMQMYQMQMQMQMQQQQQWQQQQPVAEDAKVFEGSIKSHKKGYGFIVCAEAHAIYGRDVHFSTADLPAGAKVGDRVKFKIELSSKDHPNAKSAELIPMGC